MPHLVIEYSEPLPHETARRLCKKMAESLEEHTRADGSHEFPPDGTFVRAYRAEITQHDETRRDAEFVHAILKIGPGRDGATKSKTGAALLQALRSFFCTGDPTKHSPAISVELQELPFTLWRS